MAYNSRASISLGGNGGIGEFGGIGAKPPIGARDLWETIAMRGLLLVLMALLMVVWTAGVVADLWYVYMAESGSFVLASGALSLAEIERLFQQIRPSVWSDAAQARAIVWGLPMMVFAMIAAISRPRPAPAPIAVRPSYMPSQPS